MTGHRWESEATSLAQGDPNGLIWFGKECAAVAEMASDDLEMLEKAKIVALKLTSPRDIRKQ
jgi:hypothetical protein